MNIRLGSKKNPSIRTFAYQGYIFSILESELALRAKVNMEGKRLWQSYCASGKIVWENDLLSIYNDTDTKFGTIDNEAVTFCDCKEKDEITLCIDYLNNVREGAIVNLFAAGRNVVESIKENSNIYRLGLTAFGLFPMENSNVLSNDIDEANAIISTWQNDGKKIKYLKLKKTSDYHIDSYISANGLEWIPVSSVDLNEKIYNFGINTNNLGMGKDYYEWFYSNFINSYYEPNSKAQIYLNYYNHPYSGNVYESNFRCPFLISESINLYDAVRITPSLSSFAKEELFKGHYLSFYFDEYFVKGHPAYLKKNKNHPILIIGYDERKKEFTVLDYSYSMEEFKIDEENLVYDNIKEGGRIQRFFLNTRFEAGRNWNVKRAVEQGFKEYLSGSNMDNRYIAEMPANIGSYGIKVMDEIYGNGQNRKLLFLDRRITYYWNERALLNKQRIAFLYFKKILSDSEFSKLNNKVDEHIKHSEAMKINLLRLERYTDDKKMQENMKQGILEAMDKMYDADIDFSNEVLTILSSKGEQNEKCG